MLLDLIEIRIYLKAAYRTKKTKFKASMHRRGGRVGKKKQKQQKTFICKRFFKLSWVLSDGGTLNVFMRLGKQIFMIFGVCRKVLASHLSNPLL